MHTHYYVNGFAVCLMSFFSSFVHAGEADRVSDRVIKVEVFFRDEAVNVNSGSPLIVRIANQHDTPLQLHPQVVTKVNRVLQNGARVPSTQPAWSKRGRMTTTQPAQDDWSELPRVIVLIDCDAREDIVQLPNLSVVSRLIEATTIAPRRYGYVGAIIPKWAVEHATSCTVTVIVEAADETELARSTTRTLQVVN